MLKHSVWGVLSLLVASLTALADTPKSTLTMSACEARLRAKERILQSDQHFTIMELPGHSGFVFRPNGVVVGQPRQLVSQSSIYDFPFLDKEIWSVNGKDFEFLDVGFKNLTFQSANDNLTIIKHLRQSPDRILIVDYDPLRIKAENALIRARWAVHARVLQEYHKRKPYLTDEDFQLLKAMDNFSGNSDVFAISTYAANQFLTDLDLDEIYERILLAIQVSYYGDHDYLLPTAREMAKNAGMDIHPNIDWLPFEYRISKDHRLFREKLYRQYDRKTSCEFTRFAGFDKIPEVVHDHLILRAFTAAARRGCTTIFASADDSTARLFRRYGFKVQSPLPTGTGKAEYLMVLTVDTPEYRAAIRLLHQSNAEITNRFEAYEAVDEIL